MSDPTLQDVVKSVGDLTTAANMMWTLSCGFLVMFMQLGFAMLETGLTRAKNVSHTMAMNLMVYAIGILGFWAVGFGLQMGGVGALATYGNDATLNHEFTLTLAGKEFGLFGLKGFFLTFENYTPAVATMFLFQMVFMDTAATIPTGALAERWKFPAFCLFSVFVTTLIYPIYANWVWGGGWLASLGKNFGLGHGHVDFAGSSVVHMTGGVMALIGAKMIGPRIGKFSKDGSPLPIPGHNIPMAIFGTLVLAFGWFGFNAGSTLAGADSRIAVVATNTMLASAAGAATATIYVKIRYGKPDPTWMANGLLAGLVAITAPCAFVGAPSAILIGAIAGILAVLGSVFVEQKLRIDDPVGAVAVHGVNGLWGVLSVGLFANGSYGDALNGAEGTVRGLFFGDAGQLVAQCIGIVSNIVYVGIATVIFYTIVEKVIGNRSLREDEIAGLDQPELGVEGYPEDAASRHVIPDSGYRSSAEPEMSPAVARR